MATSFTVIYNKFLAQVKDVGLTLFTDEELQEILLDYLENASIEFVQCTKSENIDYTLKCFNDDLTKEEIYIYSLGMVLNWLKPKIQSEQLLRQGLGDRDFKLTSNWETLGKLMQLEESTRKNLRNYILRYQYKSQNIEKQL